MRYVPLAAALATALLASCPALADEPVAQPEASVEAIEITGPAVVRRATRTRIARVHCRRCRGGGLPWGGLREPRVAEVPWGGLDTVCPPPVRITRSAVVRVKG